MRNKNTGNSYPLGGMIIISVLMIIGLFLIFLGINTNLIITLYGIFFLDVGAYVWFSFICNTIIKPKKEVLFLQSNESNIYEFMDRNGKRYYQRCRKKLEINRFYVVLKTKDDIRRIIGTSNEKFEIVKKKENFWLYFYFPFGKIENYFILPVVYLLFIIGFYSIFKVSGIDYSLIEMVVISLFLIIYDLIYKLKKLNNNNNVTMHFLDNIFMYLVSILKILPILLILFLLVSFFLLVNSILVKLLFLPLILFLLSHLLEITFIIKEKERLAKIANKISKLIVVSFILMILLIMLYGFISVNNYLAFTICGILTFFVLFILIKELKK